MPAFPVLTTPRLLLRELVESDTDEFFEIHRDHDAMRWFGSEPIEVRSQAQQLINIFAQWRTQASPGTRWGITKLEDGQLLGSVGLFKWNQTWRNCIVGYELRRSAWGQGYMQEALKCVLGFGFSEMHLHRVQAEIHPENVASIRLVDKLGFKFEGTHRQQGYWAGRFHDLDCYALLAQDWHAAKG